MTLIFFTVAVGLVQILSWIIKIILCVTLAFFLFKGICRAIISVNFDRINRVDIYKAKRNNKDDGGPRSIQSRVLQN